MRKTERKGNAFLRTCVVSFIFTGLLTILTVAGVQGLRAAAGERNGTLSGAAEITAQTEVDPWLADAFAEPDAAYRMIKLLYRFDADYTAAIDTLANRYGYGGVTTNVPLDETYLKSDTEFALLDDAFAQCRENGLTQLWIYDEYQWPSGTAYGMVTQDNPEYATCGLAMLTKEGSGKTQYRLPEPYIAIRQAELTVNGAKRSVRFTDKTAEIDVSGKWKLHVWATRSAWVERENLNDWQKGRPYVNIMSEDAIAKFIAITHETYRAKLPRAFGGVEAFFTDEPSLFTSNMTNPIHTGGTVDEDLVPWEDSLPDVFQRMHGYDVLDKASSLYSGDTTEDKIVRVHFYQTVARMIADHYFGQIAHWCDANGVKSSGHMLLEEQLAFHVALYGDFMRCMNATGYPGCDLLHVSPRKLMDTETWFGSFVGIKMASSSVRNMNKQHVMVEFNPEAAEDEDFRADPFGASFAGAAITRMYGADKFVMLNPQESYSAAQAAALNQGVGRMNVLLENAQMNSGLAVYYPIAAVQGRVKAATRFKGEVQTISEKYNALCRHLLVCGFDYNYLDDEAILSGTVSGGSLCCGSARYCTIVMAHTEALDPDVLDKLIVFQKAGGVVIWVDALPEYSTGSVADRSFSDRLRTFSDCVVNTYGGRVLENLTDSLSSVIRYGYSVRNGEILYSPYVRDGRQLFVAVNPTNTEKTWSVRFGEGETFDVYDLSDGTITSCSGDSTLTLGGYRAVILVHEGEKPPEINQDYHLVTHGGILCKLLSTICAKLSAFFRRITDTFSGFFTK